MSFPACLLGPGLQPAARPLSWPTSGLYLDDIISLELLGTWTVSVFLGLNLCFYLLKWICLTPPPPTFSQMIRSTFRVTAVACTVHGNLSR